MLDGKRYYAMFPDEDPELQPRIRAVLDALGNLDNHSDKKHFSQTISTGTAGPADPRCFAITRSLQKRVVRRSRKAASLVQLRC